MLIRACCVLALVLPAACTYPPLPLLNSGVRCALDRTCPSGLTCNAQGLCEPLDGGVVDVGQDGAVIDLSPICASIALGNPQFHASACSTPSTASIHIAANTSIDTDQGNSDPSGLACDRVLNGTDRLCVLAAPSIAVDAGVVLSAHGLTPLALFAHAITIRGTVDVASHIGKPTGAGALVGGCLHGTMPELFGGGHGGSSADIGGAGGDEGLKAGTGGTSAGSFAFDAVIGGCGGSLGGDGSAGGGDDGGRTTGGAGGGAVWFVSDTAPLILDNGAAINASGASGVGGTTEGHGGAGGGAGGLIVLEAPTIQLSSSAVVFANGGHGGGGAGRSADKPGFTPGADGTDPTDPTSSGAGGDGGLDGDGGTGSPAGGNGGPGYPTAHRTGQQGASGGHGGGGGGGSPGAIRVVSTSDITGPNVSPPPVLLQ